MPTPIEVAPPHPSPPRLYYQDQAVTLYHGDALELLASVGAVDTILTDPPYGIGYASNTDGSIRRAPIAGDDSTALRDRALEEVQFLGALVFGSWKRPKPPGTRAVLTWEKGPHVGMGDLALPWRPNTEEIYVLGSGFHGHRGSSVLAVHAVPPNLGGGMLHPNEKPVALLRQLLAKCTGRTVLDPFAGSGSTLRAAKDLGRLAIGCEIEERYCEIAANRLRQEVLDL